MNHVVVKVFFSDGRDPRFVPIAVPEGTEAVTAGLAYQAAEDAVARCPGANRARVYMPVNDFDVAADWGFEINRRDK